MYFGGLSGFTKLGGMEDWDSGKKHQHGSYYLGSVGFPRKGGGYHLGSTCMYNRDNIIFGSKLGSTYL